MIPTRTCQFINDRLLLSVREDEYGQKFYDIEDVSCSARIKLTLTEDEWAEADRIINSEFAIPEKIVKPLPNDDIPF